MIQTWRNLAIMLDKISLNINLTFLAFKNSNLYLSKAKNNAIIIRIIGLARAIESI